MGWSKGNNFGEWVHFAAVMSQNQQIGAGSGMAGQEKCKQRSLEIQEILPCSRISHTVQMPAWRQWHQAHVPCEASSEGLG